MAILHRDPWSLSIVIDSTNLKEISNASDSWHAFIGMLLLLKECMTYGRYNNKSSQHKNVEMLMAFKKSCGNMIKFATSNMPHALIQVETIRQIRTRLLRLPSIVSFLRPLSNVAFSGRY